MAGATVTTGGDAVTTVDVSTSEAPGAVTVDNTTGLPVDPWDRELARLKAELGPDGAGDGTEADGAAAGDGTAAGTDGTEGAAPVGDGTEGAAAGGGKRKDRTEVVPMDRFEKVVAERNAALKELDKRTQDANFEAGRADALEGVVKATKGVDTPTDDGIPTDPVAIIEAAQEVYDKDFEEGRLSASEWRRKTREAEELRNQIIAKDHADKKRAEAETNAQTLHEQIVNDPSVVELDQELHAAHPWVASLPKKIFDDLVVATAHEELGPLKPTVEDTIRLHRAVYQTAIDLGLQRKYDKTAKPGTTPPQTGTTTPPRKPQVTGDQREAKVALAGKQPPAPGIGAAGASAEGTDTAATGDIGLLAYEKMSPDQRRAFMAKQGLLPPG